MSNCCMRSPAKFHVDSAARFWAIANIREGGGVKRPPPGQARVKQFGSGAHLWIQDVSNMYEILHK